jgi:hypothetical protein
LQHPFISCATDPKPIRDLLAEFKAEIVEEEIMDINEDKEVRCPDFRILRFIFIFVFVVQFWINPCLHKQRKTIFFQ